MPKSKDTLTNNAAPQSAESKIVQTKLTDLAIEIKKEELKESSRKALQYIIDHIDHYANFMSKGKDESINNLLNGEWADHLFIHASAKALNITIIIKSSSDHPEIVNKSKTAKTIYVGQEAEVVNNVEIGWH
jgi:OTU-like cysteine protease